MGKLENIHEKTAEKTREVEKAYKYTRENIGRLYDPTEGLRMATKKATGQGCLKFWGITWGSVSLLF